MLIWKKILLASFHLKSSSIKTPKIYKSFLSSLLLKEIRKRKKKDRGNIALKQNN